MDKTTYETAEPQDAHDLAVEVGAPLLIQIRTAATAERVTRVMRYIRLAERTRLVWEMGDGTGLDLIRTTAQQEEGEPSVSRYLICRARPDDLDAVMDVLHARIAWLHERGSDQWSTRAFQPIMTEAVAAGDTWLLYDQETPVATMTMTTIGDLNFWTTPSPAGPTCPTTAPRHHHPPHRHDHDGERLVFRRRRTI